MFIQSKSLLIALKPSSNARGARQFKLRSPSHGRGLANWEQNEFRSSSLGGFYHFGTCLATNGVPRSPSRHYKTHLAVNGRGPGAWFAFAHYLGEMFPQNRGSPAACIAKQAASRDKVRPTLGMWARGSCLRFAKYLVDWAAISSPETAVSQASISPGAPAAGEPPKCGNTS